MAGLRGLDLLPVTITLMAQDGYYERWMELMGWMRAYAEERGLHFAKESDFTDFIYRMNRNYALPTTVQAVSLGLPDGTPVLIASASPPHEPLKSIQLRQLGAHREWHLHADSNGLFEGRLAFTQTRFGRLADQVFASKV